MLFRSLNLTFVGMEEENERMYQLALANSKRPVPTGWTFDRFPKKDWAPTQQNSINIHLFRYADLLLLLAEALVETNDLAGATAIVNQIRARAAVTAQGPGTDRATIAVPITSPSITWAVYRVSPYPVFASQAFGRNAVRTERRLELAMEGQRLFDLRRWQIADATLNGYINGIGGGAEKTRRLYKASAEPFTAKHALYPIPQIQISLSRVGGQDRLTQNPGW